LLPKELARGVPLGSVRQPVQSIIRIALVPRCGTRVLVNSGNKRSLSREIPIVISSAIVIDYLAVGPGAVAAGGTCQDFNQLLARIVVSLIEDWSRSPKLFLFLLAGRGIRDASRISPRTSIFKRAGECKVDASLSPTRVRQHHGYRSRNHLKDKFAK